MAITSVIFGLFLILVFFVYFLIPGKWQWIVLLAASLFFYCRNDWHHVVFLVATALTIWLAARGMDRLTDTRKAWLKANRSTASKEEKKRYKARNKRQRVCILLTALAVSLGFLIYFKYFHLLLRLFNTVLSAAGQGQIPDVFEIAVPLGISFYTFQVVGYLADVYWEMMPAEKNFGRMLLFTSFFPQITQGPISEWEQLSGELFTVHRLSYLNFSRGFQRMIWGFMKKILLSDLLSPYVTDAFKNYAQYPGLTVFAGALLYSVQIYADFSGYMDIMCGFCEMLGIHLMENFERPYFSKSVAEYWRRWHISLGNWFKKYIYYPMGMTSWSRKIAKALKPHLGVRISSDIPATIALIVVWGATGLWHGASGGYLVWGLLNGLFIILEMWMEPVYASWKKDLHIREESLGWHLFQVIRTFLLVTFIKVLPEVGTLSDGLGFWRQIFTDHRVPDGLVGLFPALATEGVAKFVILVSMTAVLFACSCVQRKHPVRDDFGKIPAGLRIILLAGAFLLMFYIGTPDSNGGFMYARF